MSLRAIAKLANTHRYGTDIQYNIASYCTKSMKYENYNHKQVASPAYSEKGLQHKKI